jgi:putative transposase
VTPPRYIVEDQLAFVTCAAVGRSFRFLPTSLVVEILWFALAVMVNKHGVAVHEAFFASNHFHVVLTDVKGNLPAFMRDFNSLISRSLNALRGTTGTNIEKGYNIVSPADDEKVVEHCVYSLLNACAAHLVERARDWLGLSTLHLEYDKPVVVERPAAGLWKNAGKGTSRRTSAVRGSAGRAAHAGRTTMPSSIAFTLVRPPVHLELGDEALRELIRSKVQAGEEELITQRRAEGRRVLGMQRVLRQSWSDTPATSRVLFETTPRVSGRSKWARLEHLGRRLNFESAYRAARTKLDAFLRRAGRFGDALASRVAKLAALGEIVFPRGTYLVRCRYALTCE